MVPLLHACLVENPRVCGITHGAHSITEEREVRFLEFDNFILILLQKVLARNEEHFDCVLRGGQFFLVNVLAFSGIYFAKLNID